MAETKGTVSIFRDNVMPPYPTVKELIGIHALELTVCESLLLCGWKFANRMDISERAEWLEKRIANLEAQLKGA